MQGYALTTRTIAPRILASHVCRLQHQLCAEQSSKTVKPLASTVENHSGVTHCDGHQHWVCTSLGRSAPRVAPPLLPGP
eukprot:scaffold125623_cov63-Phaeocystis_antarctica.AAC.2